MIGNDVSYSVPGEKDERATDDARLGSDDPDSQLARQLAEAAAAAKPRDLTLRRLVRQHGDVIRDLVVAEGSWNKSQALVEQRLGRRINLRSLQTYVSDFYPQKDLMRASGPETQTSLAEHPSQTKRADAVPPRRTRPVPSAVRRKGPNPFHPQR